MKFEIRNSYFKLIFHSIVVFDLKASVISVPLVLPNGIAKNIDCF